MDIRTNQPEPQKTSSARPMIVATCVVVFAVATNVYLFTRMKRLEVKAHTMRTQMETEIAKVHESSAYRMTQARREFEDLREELKKAQSQVAKKTDADTRARAQRLADHVTKQQREQQEMLLGEIRTASGKAGEAQQSVDQVRGDVQVMQSDAEATRTHLYETDEAVRSTRNLVLDLDGQVSSHEADIRKLHELGERERVAFALTKSDQMQRIGEVYLRLKSASPRNNRFTLEVMADDKTVEQKKKYVHEAMRFYLPGSAQPYDIVVTSVQRDQVNGYVSKAKTPVAHVASVASR